VCALLDRDGHVTEKIGTELESGYIFRIRIKIFGKSRIRYEWFGVYRMYVKVGTEPDPESKI